MLLQALQLALPAPRDAAPRGYSIPLIDLGTFLATTYGHWSEGEQPCVVRVRFQLEELDARR